MTKKTELFERLTSLLTLLILVAALSVPQALADVPMPADKSVAAPAEPAIESSTTTTTTGDKPYAQEAVKHYNRGVELHQAGFFNQAIAEYRAAIESDPRMEEAWSNLGGIYAAQRSYPRAMEAFEKALAIKPDRPTTLNGYGTVLYARGKIAEAKDKWKQAVAIEPTFASAYYNMGNALEGEKDVASAADAYYQAIQANPNMADAFYRIGTIYQKEKHYAQAKVLLQKSMELGPEADFVREAKKQIAVIDGLLAGDVSDKQDVQMNVIVPPSKTEQPAAVPHSHTHSTQSAKSSQGKASKEPKEHKGLFSHHKKEKRVDMFVQSADQPMPDKDVKVPDKDLQEKPAE